MIWAFCFWLSLFSPYPLPHIAWNFTSAGKPLICLSSGHREPCAFKDIKDSACICTDAQLFLGKAFFYKTFFFLVSHQKAPQPDWCGELRAHARKCTRPRTMKQLDSWLPSKKENQLWVLVTGALAGQDITLLLHAAKQLYCHCGLWVFLALSFLNAHPALKPLLSEAVWKCCRQPALTFSFCPFSFRFTLFV